MFSTACQFVKHSFRGTYKDSKYAPSMGTLYDLKAVDIDGKEIAFNDYKGKVALITNVACLCGYTEGTYPFLASMYKKYKDDGLVVMGFPSNQFGGQEPWPEAKIKEFVQKYDVQFPMFAKIDVNGPNTHPVYALLKGAYPGDVTWNFSSKFVVDRNGVPVARFEKESFEEIEKFLQEQLQQKPKL